MPKRVKQVTQTRLSIGLHRSTQSDLFNKKNKRIIHFSAIGLYVAHLNFNGHLISLALSSFSHAKKRGNQKTYNHQRPKDYIFHHRLTIFNNKK